jgi:hypothetical protein
MTNIFPEQLISQLLLQSDAWRTNSEMTQQSGMIRFYSSQDIDFWGFVPEENIVGKASTVFFLKNDDSFN